MDISGTECARARESVSADLDGELHELDLRRLRSHLRVCADCSAWADRVWAATALIRHEPLEALPAAALELPRRGRGWRIGPASAVAPVAALAAAAVAVLLGGAPHGQLGRQPNAAPMSPADRNMGPVAQHRAFHAV